MPLYPRSVTSQGACPNFLLFHCFHFKITFESFEEVGSVASIFLGASVFPSLEIINPKIILEKTMILCISNLDSNLSHILYT